MSGKIGVGVGVMILRDNKVLLGLRNPDKHKAGSELQGEGTWTMPGGKVDFGETLLDAAKRETREENGIEFSECELVSLVDDIVAQAHYVTAGFLVQEYDNEPVAMEPETILKWEWFDVNDLPENLYSASANLLEHWRNGCVYMG